MGLRHGAVCVGCCWLLTLLLFVGGVMNLTWIAGIALFVLAEKLLPAGHWIGKGAGSTGRMGDCDFARRILRRRDPAVT
jgi:predicted metal-binding membrane protein